MEIVGHSRLNVNWTSKYYCQKTQNLVPCLVKCQGRRDFASPSPNKHQSNSEAALISNKIEVEIYLLDNAGEKNWQR